VGHAPNHSARVTLLGWRAQVVRAVDDELRGFEVDGDEDITPLDTNNNPPLNVQGPITRAQARQLNLEVSSFLNSSSYDYENRLLPNDYIVIRNHGEGQGIIGEGFRGVEDQQGHTSKEGGPNQLTSGLFLGSRSSLRKMDAQDTYRLRFG
jgi:hypothetical protein